MTDELQCTGEKGSAKQATSRQLVIIIFVLGLASNMFLQPIFLIRAAGRDAYIALAVHAGADLLSLAAFLVAIKLSPDADFFSLLRTAFGEVGARVTAALIGLFFLFKVNVAAAETVSFYSDSVFAGSDTTLMSALLVIFFMAAAVHTLKALARVNELVAPLIAICLVTLVIIVAATGYDLANILPVMREPKVFSDALLRHASWIGDFTPLALFIGRTGTKKRTAAWGMTAGVIASGVAVFFAIVMCAAFGNLQTAVDTSTNLSSILQYSTGNMFGRIDLIAVMLWSLASFIEGALFFYCMTRCFECVMGRSAHLPVALVTGVVTFFIQVFALSDPTVLTVFTANYAASAVITAFTAAIPMIAIFAALKSGRRDKLRKAEGAK